MIDNLNTLLSEVKTVAISGHIRPDGDCVGSCMAMYNYLDTYFPNIEAQVYLETIPKNLVFMKNTEKVKLAVDETPDRVFDLFIALDCSEGHRLGDAYRFFETAKHTICIDHHFSNPNGFAEYNYIVPDESSTAELVYNQLPKECITKDIAECLYTGIIHDTGVFQYSCTTENTMKAGGFLMNCGIDYAKICNDSYFSKSFVQNKMLGIALDKCKLYLDGKVIASVITKEELDANGAFPRHLEGIVQQLKLTTGVEVAIFLYETAPGEFKGSTRATGDVNLVELCAPYGGGGHIKASGFSVETNDPWGVIDDLNCEIKKQFIRLGI